MNFISPLITLQDLYSSFTWPVYTFFCKLVGKLCGVNHDHVNTLVLPCHSILISSVFALKILFQFDYSLCLL